jgi:hypothetical protein
MANGTEDKPIGELSREERLDRALKPKMTELPENQPKGLLGEPGLNVGKTDEFEPDLNAGISQENDMPVLWMAVLLGYLIFFVPGFVILWMSKRIPQRTKIIASIAMAIGAVAFLVYLSQRVH